QHLFDKKYLTTLKVFSSFVLLFLFSVVVFLSFFLSFFLPLGMFLHYSIHVIHFCFSQLAKRDLQAMNEIAVPLQLQLGIRSAPVRTLALARLRGDMSFSRLNLTMDHLRSVLLIVDEITDSKVR